MLIVLANVIVPAPSAAYVAGVFFPLAGLAALGAEWMVFCRYQAGLVSPGRTFTSVVCANVVSWVVGIVASGMLPSGLVPSLVGDPEKGLTIIGPGPSWDAWAIASFFIACALSILIEYLFPLLMSCWFPWRSLAACTVAANVASYLVLGMLVAVHLGVLFPEYGG
jgi:hypothetical protein